MTGHAVDRTGHWRGLVAALCLASIVATSLPLRCVGQNVVDGFDAGVQGSGNPGVTAMAVQPDGKIIVGGSFTTVNSTSRSNIARLNIDGTLDTTFVASNIQPANAVAVQADGKILVGNNTLVRLNSDGSPDATFASPSLDQPVHAIAVQGDGKILIGGAFTSVAGTSRHVVARLNANGSLDDTFAVPTPNTNASVSAMILQPDGKIIIGGFFSTFAFQSSHGVARLNTDGTLDYAFVDPNVTAAGNAVVYALALQTDGQIVIGGDFSSVGGQTHANVARLGADGSVDMTFYDVGLDNYVTSLLVRPDGTILVGGYFGDFVDVLASDGHFAAQYFPTANDAVTSLIQQADGKILIGGYFTYIGGAPGNGIARLYATGAIDSDLTDGAVGGQVSALAVQTDGKIIVGGGFTAIRTSPSTTIGHAGIARFNVDGSLDAYDPLLTAANPPSINALALQPDGKTIIAGYFTGIDSQARNKIARVNVDGGLDAAFDANQNPNDFISALAVQPDGKIVVGGPFTYISGQTRNHIARLNADGTLDAPFNPNADSGIGAIALQADGKLVVAGSFSTIGGGTRHGVARLYPDGSLDDTFIDPAASGGGVSSLIVQPDGKILVAGFFLMIGGQSQCCIARLDADGTLDQTFSANPDNYVEALALQTDGKIVIGGLFNYVSGVFHEYLARLNSNGSLDMTFDADANNSVLALALQSDGKLVVGGLFTTLGGKPRIGVARLSEPVVGQESLDVVGYTVGGGTATFMRSGEGPEFGLPPQLSLSTDGISFAPVGSMQRINGGWRYTGLALPPLNQHFYLRATGQFTSGQLNGSGGMIWNTGQFYLGSNDGIFADGFE